MSAEAKQVVPRKDLVSEQANEISPAPPEPKTQAAPKQRWKFVKTESVAQTLRFKDGTKFKFDLIPLNDRPGFAATSEVITEDERLAKNLRALANAGRCSVFEIKV
jgi:hypothetical protein